MGKFIRKAVVIQAVQLKFTTESQQKCIDFTDGKARKGLDGGLIIPTLEGDMVANTGSWIIKGVKGEFYSCKPDIFKEIYEEV